MVDLREALPALGRALFGSTAGGATELDDADRTIRQGVPTSRRMGFTSLHGGTGCSTVAAAVASVLASRRPGRVLGVDGAAGPRPFVLLAGASTPGPTTRSSRREAARTSWDATDGLERASTGLHLLRLGAPSLPDRPASPADWADATEPIARFFDVVVGDWGRRSPFVDLGAVADDSHVVALVAGPDRGAVEEAVSHAGAIERHAAGTRVVVVAVDTVGIGDAAARVAATWGRVPVLRVPSDPSLADPRRSRPARVRAAYITLTAELMRSALGTGDPAPLPTPGEARA
ncbi:hypothetical protein [Curtobacterium sp. Leaf261]|uniref:hypothetical protein n=1 Tax=Curtobacterium sp. Leaf261 TaxID=1736311 RepID=UPI0006F9A615|nr:hypothetical protein [Curtobacterium sp. Leaf261]KQO62220.1 hypothetical protein ASF23_10390 [Curtobacterium sp. Leaf261]